MAAAGVVHVSVSQMIDLAIGHPEVGTVDFTMLQSVLHVIAQQLHILHVGVELHDAAPPAAPRRVQTVAVTEYVLQPQDAQEAPVPVEVVKPDVAAPATMLVVERVKKGNWNADGRRKSQADPGFKGGAGADDADEPTRRLSVVTLPEFQRLEQSFDKLHNQLFGGPTNDKLLDEIRAHPGSKSITDMWTSMNWSSRIETLESGLQKLSSLVQDLAGEYVAVQDALSPSTATKFGELGEASDVDGAASTAGSTVAGSFAGGRRVTGALPPRSLAEQVEQLRGDMGRLGIVLQQLTGVDVIAAAAALDVDRSAAGGGGGGGAGGGGGVGGVAAAGAAGGLMASGPLKKLRDRVESIEKKMRKCCDRLNKVDGAVGEQLSTLQDQVVGLGDDIATVNENLSLGSLSPDLIKDVQGLAELFAVVQRVQAELQTMREAAASFEMEKEERAHNFNVLLEQIELLKTIKMDREDMAEAMAEKADARLVARKVSRDQFEMTCDDLSRGLDTAISKLTTQEALWQQALDDIQREIECKLDRLEMAPVKQFFCDKLRQLQDNLRQMASLRREAEAAGTRKSFLRDVNCISCDARAIMAMAEATTLPAGRSMPAQSLSMKPYLTYELDQVRKQQAAGAAQRNMHDWETIDKQSKPNMRARSETGKHLCNRYCGGSHTVTTPAQRVTRLGHFLKQWGPDVMPLPPARDETSKPAKEEPDHQGAFAQKAPGDKKARPHGECRCVEDDRA